MPDISQLQTRIASALQISFADAEQLASRLLPVILVDDIQQIGDSADTATRWVMGEGSATGVADLAQVGLSNPAASGMRLITEGVFVSSDTAGQLRGGFVEPALTLTSERRGIYRDGGPGLPVGLMHNGNSAVVPSPDLLYDCLATNAQWWPIELILQPNVQFRIHRATTAETLQVTWFWKEVKLPTIL